MKYPGKDGLPFWIEVSEEERNTMKAAAANKGLSLKRWLRQAVECELKRDGIFFEASVSESSQQEADA